MHSSIITKLGKLDSAKSLWNSNYSKFLRSVLISSLGIFIVILLSTCTGQKVNPNPASPQPSVIPVQTFDQSWLISLKITGGFAGIQRTIELTSRGDLRVIDDRSGKQVMQNIPASELADFSSLVSKVVQVKDEIVPNCADCFIYQVFIRRDNNIFSATLNDVNLADSGWADLINHLMRLGNDALGN